MRDTASAASYAIQIARDRNLLELGPDELLLGCLQAIARFGIARFGRWTFDLEAQGIDWLEQPKRTGAPKVSYSDATVEIFDRAGRIARVDNASEIRIEHLLVAFATEDTGLMGSLKLTYAIDSAAWRAAAASLANDHAENAPSLPTGVTASADAREYVTPEEAAEILGIHVQTMRTYVRTGKLPALRLAGERSLRIRRSDLDKVLEPLIPETR